ncbi:MAG: hypothetical protein GWO24_04110 [Akkermansiaceae bacterium]|nr:hypothetical protein [Akkermansiaceae bacterium]
MKGLAWNLGYGTLALAYAAVLGSFENRAGSPGAAIQLALPWQAAWFATTITLFFAVFGRTPRSPTAPNSESGPRPRAKP